MAILSFGGINKSLFSTGRKTSLASKTIKNISNVLLNKTSSKKNISNNILRFKSRRIENERRMQAQSELFASSQVRTSGGARRLALSGVGGSFLSRIMEFGAFMTAGWILTNMPTWTAGANELSNRIQSLNSTFTGFVDNIWDMMADIGRISGALFENMKAFDLTDSSYRVRNSMSGLISTLDSMGDQIKEAFSVITEPFMNVPPLGSKGDDGAYPDVPAADSGEPAPSGGGGGGRYGTKEERSLLDAISFAEGTKSSYGTMFGGGINKDLESGKLTVKQVIDLGDAHAKKNGRSGAAGRYQFMPFTLEDLVRTGDLKMDDKFTTQMQDKAALALARRRKVTSELLKKEGLSAKVSNMLAPEWASLPTYSGASYYGQPVKSLSSIQSVYKKSLGSSQQPSSQQQSSRKPSAQVSSRSSGSGGKVIEYLTGDRKHKRYRADHAAGNYHDHFAFDGQATRDAAMKWLRGKGWTIGSINTGKHAEGSYHYSNQAFDIPFYPNQSKKGVTDDAKGETALSSSVRKDLISGGFIGSQLGDGAPQSGQSTPSTPSSSLVPSSTPSTPQTPSEVQIESPETGYDLLSEILLNANLTANRQDIVLINDLQPSISQMSGGSGGSSLSMRISESDIVNSFIKSKLLLDLNYL